MKNNKYKLVVSLASLAFLASCGNNATTATNTNTAIGTTGAVTSDVETELADKEVPETATVAEEGTLAITEAGDYVLTGAYTGVTVNLTEAGEVHLFLNGATIAASKKAIEVQDKVTTKLVLTVVDGTENTITASKNAIDSTTDVVVNGAGVLNVTSTGKSCLKAEGKVTIGNATLNLTASGTQDGHGISGHAVLAVDATINVIDAGKDGIHAEMDDSVTAWTNEDGYVVLKNTNFKYNYINNEDDVNDADAGSGDGIQADTFILVDGGEVDVTTQSQMIAYDATLVSSGEYEADDFKYSKNGNDYAKVASEQRGRSGTYAIVESVKGFKVGAIDYDDADGVEHEVTSTTGEDYFAQITNAKLTFNTFDDSIRVNYGKIIMENSTMTAATHDQAISADGKVYLTNNTVNVTTSYEAIQGSVVTIDGNDTVMNLVATDDGMNAASDYYTKELSLVFNGGLVNVDAQGDGIDSNGSIYFNDGTVIINGPSSNGDAPIDSDGGIYMNGATVMAAGSRGMVESPSTSSTAYSIILQVILSEMFPDCSHVSVGIQEDM